MRGVWVPRPHTHGIQNIISTLQKCTSLAFTDPHSRSPLLGLLFLPRGIWAALPLDARHVLLAPHGGAVPPTIAPLNTADFVHVLKPRALFEAGEAEYRIKPHGASSCSRDCACVKRALTMSGTSFTHIGSARARSCRSVAAKTFLSRLTEVK